MKAKLFAFLTTALLSTIAFAQSDVAGRSTYRNDTNPDVNVYKTGDIGVGVEIGAPTGIDVKYWTSEATAFRGGVAWQNGNAAVLADYLYHFRGALSNLTEAQAASTLVPYAGLGAIVNFGVGNNFWNRNTAESTQSSGVGARVPVGLEFLPRGVPVGIFAEVIPGVVFTPTSFGFFQADLGGRYYF